MKKNIGIWLLHFIGSGALGACLLFLFRGRGFSVMGISNPSPYLCLVLGAAAWMAAYLWQDKGPELKFRVANLVLMSFSLLLVTGIGEVGIRMFLQRTQGFNSVQQLFNPNPVGNLPTDSHHPLLVITRLSSDKRLIYELKPNLDREFGHNLLRTNAAGMRADRDYPGAKPDGVLRVIGVGDSGMWGWGLDQGEGYMEVAGQEWNARGDLPPVEVLNLAVPGYNTYQELQSLESKGLAYQPDVVVIGWCDNDFMLPFFMYSRRDHWKEPGSYFLSLLIDRRAFLEKVTPEVLKLGDMPEGSVDAAVMEHAGDEGVRKSLRRFRELGVEHGFQVLLFGPLNARIEDICRDVGIPTLNTYSFRDSAPAEDCQAFFMHPKACGHAWLGKVLADDVVARGWLR
jgi:hypothetical protein